MQLRGSLTGVEGRRITLSRWGRNILKAGTPTFVLATTFALTLLATGYAPGFAQEGRRPTNNPTAGSEPRLVKQQALDLVAAAVGLTDQLDPGSQGLVFSLAGDVVLSAAPEKAKEYYLAALDSAEKMDIASPSNLRVGMQEGIVARFSMFDPTIGIELLRRVDKPDWTMYPGVDFRTRSALRLTRSLLNRNSAGDLERAVDLIQYVADTGQFPYAAAAEVIPFLHQRGEDQRCAEVFAGAMDHFREDAGFKSSSEDFAQLISATAEKIPASLVASAIRLLVSTARKSEQGSAGSKDQPQRVFILSSKYGQLRLNSGATYLALRMVSIAARFDSKLAEELKTGDPELRQLTSNWTAERMSEWAAASLSVVTGKARSETLAEVEGIIRQRRNLREVQEVAEKDPQKAATLANEIAAPALRSRGLAAVARANMKSDPTLSASLLAEAESLAKKIASPRDKIEALEEIAAVWTELNNAPKAAPLLDLGFSLAEESYSQEKKSETESPLLAESVTLVLKLVSTETKLDVNASLTRTRQILDPALRAYCLIYVADGLFRADRESSGKAPELAQPPEPAPSDQDAERRGLPHSTELHTESQQSFEVESNSGGRHDLQQNALRASSRNGDCVLSTRHSGGVYCMYGGVPFSVWVCRAATQRLGGLR